MYMRPQLGRHKTENKEILAGEHAGDVNELKKELAEGRLFEADMERISQLISAVSTNENISPKDKAPILEQLKETLNSLQREYEHDIENTIEDIEDSMKERIEEIGDATRKREQEVFKMEDALWETKVVDKKKLVSVTRELHDQYCSLLEHAKEDLDCLMAEAEEQRTRIKEYRKNR